MSERHAELKLRARMFTQEARASMELAENAKTDEHRAEYLRIAVEWLKLGSEVHAILELAEMGPAG